MSEIEREVMDIIGLTVELRDPDMDKPLEEMGVCPFDLVTIQIALEDRFGEIELDDYQPKKSSTPRQVAAEVQRRVSGRAA